MKQGPYQNPIQDMLKYLYQQVAGEKRFNPRQASCTITSVVPQGPTLYATARYPDITNTDGTVTKGGYVGNEGGIKESDLILAEILVPTNIDLQMLHGTDLTSFVGQQATVTLIDGYARRIDINQNVVDARAIPRQAILAARSTNEKQSLDHPLAHAYIESQGYDTVTYSQLLKELVTTISPDGAVLVYGDTADWTRSDQETAAKNSSYNDISKTAPTKVGAVTNLPTIKLPKINCYTTPTFMAGF